MAGLWKRSVRPERGVMEAEGKVSGIGVWSLATLMKSWSYTAKERRSSRFTDDWSTPIARKSAMVERGRG